MSSATDEMPSRYEPSLIEARRQASWLERDAFKTPRVSAAERRKYVKPSAPFTSGNIHIGHVRSYSIGDSYTRFLRARGDSVLFAFGFDAFGLPAELGAITNEEPPSDWVKRCAEHMTGQLQRLGFSFDWERTFMSSDAHMYRWSQWLFLKLLEAGLIYRGTGSVDWCESCQTTLATIQVENGACWRCHGPVRLIRRDQWYLRISAYVQENDVRLSELEQQWDETSLASQRDVLGRVDGVEIDLHAADGERLTAFTPYPEAIRDARFVLISPKHPEIDRWVLTQTVAEQLDDIRSGGWQRSARDAENIPVVDTGRTVAGAAGSELPVLISPVVDSRFGPTIALGVPEQDRTDEVIAQRVALPPPTSPMSSGSEPLAARPAVRYRAYDFSISRQRSWGTPIPIIYCEQCGTVPVGTEDLPVVLPLDLQPTGISNPLAERRDFLEVRCPSCGEPARRETDTLDCHFDALWLWVPACVPPQERHQSMDSIFALEDLRMWLPASKLIAGSDSGNFMFDQRITTKALRDIGPLEFLAAGEPFAGALMHEMVIRDGRKMSKHLGNVVDPDELLQRYGADTVRLALLYAARPQRSLNWSDSAVARCHRFLGNLWQYSTSRFQMDPGTLDEEMIFKTEFLRARLQKWCNTAVVRITAELENLEMHSAVRDVMRLLERIKDFESRVIDRATVLGVENHQSLVDALALLAAMLTPLAPHIGEELWIAAGKGEPERDVPWPSLPAPVTA
jgi:leucyl-tRNA synthetase